MPDPAQAIDEARGSTFRAKLLLALLVLLIGGFIGYVMLARGVFESTQKLVLMVENAEGLSVGASESVRVTPLPLTIALFWRLEADPVDA